MIAKRSVNTALIGRAAEIAVIDQLIRDVRDGQGAVLWIEGEAGVGKSALACHLLATAADGRCQVRAGSADTLLEAFPLRPFADCLEISNRSGDPAVAEVAELLAGGGDPSGTIDPVLVASERILSLVDRLCAQHPAVILIEDLHWADEWSLLLWNRLARLTRQNALLLVATSRPQVDHALVSLVRDSASRSGDTVLSIDPFDTEASRTFAEHVLGAPISEPLAQELARADGNPLFLGELLGALREEDLIVYSGGVAELRGESPRELPTLVASISRKLSYLPPATIRALRLAAVLGPVIDVEAWHEALDGAPNSLPSVVDESIAAGILEQHGGRLRFRHSLIREALEERVPPGLRVQIHEQAASAGLRRGAGVGFISHHLMSVPLMPLWAIDWILTLSELSLHASPYATTELLRRALRVLEPASTRWLPTMSALARGEFWLGNDEQALKAARRVLDVDTDPESLGALSVQSSRSAHQLGRHDQAAQIAETALADERIPMRWKARLRAWAAIASHSAGDAEAARRAASRALDESTSCDDRLGIAYSRYALALATPSSSERLRHDGFGIEVLGSDPESTDLRVLLLIDQLSTYVEVGQKAEARAAIEDLPSLMERVGSCRAAELSIGAARACFRLGAWDDALTQVSRIETEQLEGPELDEARGIRELISAHRGNDANADAARSSPTTDRAYLGALGAQNEVDARRALAMGRAAGLSDGLLERHVYLMRLAVGLDDRAEIDHLLERIRGVAERGRHVAAVLACCEMMAAHDLRGLAGAEMEFDDMGWRMLAAFAAEELAAGCAQEGDLSQARAAFTRALRGYAELDAQFEVRRAAARLRPLGIRQGPHTLRRRETTGWEALTPTEIRVTGLVAQGMSNPDIALQLSLARSTVETHVSHVLGKLSLRSRVDLALEMQQRSARSA